MKNEKQLNNKMMVSKAYLIPGMKRDIDEVVSDVFGIDRKLLKERTRKREVIDAKYAAIWWTRNNTKLSLNAIGMNYNIDHCTVLHACSQAENWMKTDRFWRKNMNRVLELMAPTRNELILNAINDEKEN